MDSSYDLLRYFPLHYVDQSLSDYVAYHALHLDLSLEHGIDSREGVGWVESFIFLVVHDDRQNFYPFLWWSWGACDLGWYSLQVVVFCCGRRRWYKIYFILAIMSITYDQFMDLMIKCFSGSILSRIWLSFGTLFLEFWSLDDEEKWERSCMIEPSWRFQDKQHILETSDRSKEKLEQSLANYSNLVLHQFKYDEYTHELLLDFGMIQFLTFGIKNTQQNWVIFIHPHAQSLNDTNLLWTTITAWSIRVNHII